MLNIYKITNRVNGRTYIGMTSHPVSHRSDKHVRQLKRGVDVNGEFQEDWNRREADLAYDVLERVKAEARALEYRLINEEPKPYNVAVGNRGDFRGIYYQKFIDSSRPYNYAEIAVLKHLIPKQKSWSCLASANHWCQ